ncbi:hypothetical protein GGR50DRAFT_692239 [Xylaria sp. CBS 124048]|nr:hypothetical protein GGR50DRAFT_692239 [Xylaria sp. CBS 124048]
MQFITIAVSLFAAVATAQTTNSTSLPDLISQLPTCAVPCFQDAANSANCSITDFQCLCVTGKTEFISAAGACVLTKCSGDDLSSAVSTANNICATVENNPSPAEVASASAVVTSVVGASSASATPDSAAVRPELSFGMIGAAAAAMLAL